VQVVVGLAVSLILTFCLTCLFEYLVVRASARVLGDGLLMRVMILGIGLLWMLAPPSTLAVEQVKEIIEFPC
jgi:hypothetical protein